MGNCAGGKKEIKLVLIGLDLAGKTSLLNKLCHSEAGSTTPTVGFNFESTTHKSVKISIWDTGGQDKIRDLWKHYYEEVKRVTFSFERNVCSVSVIPLQHRSCSVCMSFVRLGHHHDQNKSDFFGGPAFIQPVRAV